MFYTENTFLSARMPKMATTLCIRGTEGPAELALCAVVWKEGRDQRQGKDMGRVAPRINFRAWKAAPASPRDALLPSSVWD